MERTEILGGIHTTGCIGLMEIMMLRNCLFFILLFTAPLSVCGMSEEIPETKMLIDAAEAVCSMYDIEDNLGKIELCGKWDTTLAEYAAWRRKGELDNREQRSSKALDCLLAIAESLSQTKEEARLAIARINYLRQERIWNFGKHDETTAIVSDMIALLQDCHSIEATNLKILYRAAACFQKRAIEGDNPIFWEEVNAIEQDFQHFLDGKHTEDVVLYRTLELLAQMKACETVYIVYYNTIFNNDCLKKRNIKPDTHDYDIINSNSLWYLDEALRVGEKCMNDTPCDYAFTIYYKIIHVYNHHLTQYYEETLKNAQDLRNMLQSAGVRGKAQMYMVEPWISLLEIRMGRTGSFARFWTPKADAVRAYYGEGSEELIDYLQTMSSVSYHTQRYNELTEIEEYQKRHVQKRRNENIYDDMLLQIIGFWETHANMSDSEFRNYVNGLVNKYKDIHTTKWASVEIGKLLAQRLTQELNDPETGLQIYKIALEDIKLLLPKNHLQLAFEYDRIAQLLPDSDKEEIRYYLQAEEAVIEANGIHAPLTMRNIATQYLYLNDTAKADELYRKSIADAKKAGDKITEAYCGIEHALFVTDKANKKTLMNKYSDWLLQTEEYQYHIIGVITNAAQYYIDEGEADRGLALLEKGRQLIGKSNIPTTNNTCTLYTVYANYLAEVRNEYDAALQLLEEVISIYSKENLSDGFYTDLYTLQELRYKILCCKGDGYDVLIKRMLCLQDIGNLAAKIYEVSGQSPEIRFTYMADAFCKLTYIWKWIPKFRKIMATATPGTKVYTELQSGMNAWSLFVNQTSAYDIKSFIEDLKEYDANYLKNARYYLLLATYATYCYNITEDYAEGNKVMKQLLTDCKAYNPTHYPNYLWAQIGALYEANRFEEAESCLEEYKNLLAGQEISLDIQTSITNYEYLIYHKLGRYTDCIAPAKKNFELMRQLIDLNFDMLTQQERENLIDTKGTGANYIADLLERCPTKLAAVAYDAMLHEKNLLLRSSERIRQSVMKSGNKELIAAIDSINYMRTFLTQSTGLGVGSTNETMAEYLAIQKRMEELERFVARQSAQYRKDDRMNLTWRDIKKKLKKNSAAIEFITSETKVGMLIITDKMTEPTFVPLTEYRELHDNLESLSSLSAKQYAEELYENDKLHLYDRLWKPAERYLQNIQTIYLSPTGLTNAIAFNAIKTPDGKALYDHYDIYQLSTTAFVAMPENSIQNKFNTTIFGGIFYDSEQSEYSSHSSNTTSSRHVFRGADNETFSFLQGTQGEMEVISGIVKNKGNVQTLSGMTATEQTFTSLSGKSPYLIHLATHGFYIADLRDVDEIPYFNRYPNSKYHSMQRSGLAFTNANDSWNGNNSSNLDNDGILNANEIAVLDLSTTQLVTLSACQTALGDYGTDGVYGLQRGLKQAGVRSIMASLWSVDDQCTSFFMSAFYNNWNNEASLHESLKAATTAVRQKYPSPYYWAAFILLDGLD